MKVYERQHGDYVISDDQARLDLAVIHTYLSRESYWARGVPRDLVAQSLKNSLCIGVYGSGGAQAALARIVTDGATFGWLCDVFVLPAHRGQGLGKALMQAVLSHPYLQNVRRLALATRDAHGLYAQFGFTPLADPRTQMEKRLIQSYSTDGPAS